MRPLSCLAVLASVAFSTSCLTTGGLRGNGGGVASSGSSYLVLDTNSDYILHASNHTGRRPISSLTMVATAKVVLDWANGARVPMSTIVVVPPSAGFIGGPNPIGLQPGDRISLRNALSSTMMASDSRACETLAAFVGGDLLRRSGRGGDPVVEFVKQLNSLASRQAMKNTHFANAHGMEGPAGAGHSCASDLARLCLYAVKDPSFTFYTSQKNRQVSFERLGQQHTFSLINTNTLVGSLGIDGIKTGSSPAAGGCLIISADRPNTVLDLPNGNKYIKPHRLLVIVLGSGNRFGEAQGLLARGWQTYDRWLGAGSPPVDQAKVLKTSE
jgi:D-alanyl-D-alanine carboxypeptidase (penicillin-binding protein 5/6)